MRFRFRAVALAVATVMSASVCTAAVSSTAHAADAPPGLAIAQTVFASADPTAAYAALTPTQQAEFNQAEIPVSTNVLSQTTSLPTAQVTAATFSGTFWDSTSWDAKASAGNTLYTWWQATKVWVTSGHVTQVQVYNYGRETSTPGWSYGSQNSTQTYNAGWEGRGLYIMTMVFSIPVYGVIETPTNCGQIRLNGNGYSLASSSSCNLN